MNDLIRPDLERILAWSKDKIHNGGEPPWAWYQYMKLKETIETILQGMDATIVSAREYPNLKLVGAEEKEDLTKPIPVVLPF